MINSFRTTTLIQHLVSPLINDSNCRYANIAFNFLNLNRDLNPNLDRKINFFATIFTLGKNFYKIYLFNEKETNLKSQIKKQTNHNSIDSTAKIESNNSIFAEGNQRLKLFLKTFQEGLIENDLKMPLFNLMSLLIPIKSDIFDSFFEIFDQINLLKKFDENKINVGIDFDKIPTVLLNISIEIFKIFTVFNFYIGYTSAIYFSLKTLSQFITVVSELKKEKINKPEFLIKTIITLIYSYSAYKLIDQLYQVKSVKKLTQELWNQIYSEITSRKKVSEVVDLNKEFQKYGLDSTVENIQFFEQDLSNYKIEFFNFKNCSFENCLMENSILKNLTFYKTFFKNNTFTKTTILNSNFKLCRFPDIDYLKSLKLDLNINYSYFEFCFFSKEFINKLVVLNM